MIRNNIEYKINEDGCHICTSHKMDKSGYPRLTFRGKNTPMHRYVYTVLKEEIGKGLVVRHKCDNRRCINIEHLELGTIQDNVRDRCSRGRTSRVARTNGEINGMSKLKKEQVFEILELKGKLSQTKIGEMYGVTQTTIGSILRGVSWSHLQGV